MPSASSEKCWFVVPVASGIVVDMERNTRGRRDWVEEPNLIKRLYIGRGIVPIVQHFVALTFWVFAVRFTPTSAYMLGFHLKWSTTVNNDEHLTYTYSLPRQVSSSSEYRR